MVFLIGIRIREDRRLEHRQADPSVMDVAAVLAVIQNAQAVAVLA